MIYWYYILCIDFEPNEKINAKLVEYSFNLMLMQQIKMEQPDSDKIKLNLSWEKFLMLDEELQHLLLCAALGVKTIYTTCGNISNDICSLWKRDNYWLSSLLKQHEFFWMHFEHLLLLCWISDQIPA